MQDQDIFVIQALNGVGESLDLKNALNRRLRPNFRSMTVQQFKEYAAVNGHCSALIKVTMLSLPHLLQLCSLFLQEFIIIISRTYFSDG